MKKITIEDALKIRETIRTNRDDRAYYSVIANILLGKYDQFNKEAKSIAEDDVHVLINGL